MPFHLFNKRNTQTKTDFSDFFYTASARKKKKLMTEVVRQANNDQKKLIKQYEEKVKSGIIKSV